MLEIFAEGVDRVEAVLTERKGPGSRGSPGVHQGHLHHIKGLGRVPYEGTAIRHMKVNLRTLVQMERVVGIAPTHDRIGDDGVNFDAGDTGAAVGDGA
jgi:hypothetical protein